MRRESSDVVELVPERWTPTEFAVLGRNIGLTASARYRTLQLTFTYLLCQNTHLFPALDTYRL